MRSDVSAAGGRRSSETHIKPEINQRRFMSLQLVCCERHSVVPPSEQLDINMWQTTYEPEITGKQNISNRGSLSQERWRYQKRRMMTKTVELMCWVSFSYFLIKTLPLIFYQTSLNKEPQCSWWKCAFHHGSASGTGSSVGSQGEDPQHRVRYWLSRLAPSFVFQVTHGLPCLIAAGFWESRLGWQSTFTSSACCSGNNYS